MTEAPPNAPTTPSPPRRRIPIGKPENGKTTLGVRRELLYKSGPLPPTAWKPRFRRALPAASSGTPTATGTSCRCACITGREALTPTSSTPRRFSEVPDTRSAPTRSSTERRPPSFGSNPRQGIPADVYFDHGQRRYARLRARPRRPAPAPHGACRSRTRFCPGQAVRLRRIATTSPRAYSRDGIRGERARFGRRLRPPAPTSYWTFGPPKPVPIDNRRSTTAAVLEQRSHAPFTSSSTVNGHVGHFLFDSGNGAGTLMSEDVRKQAAGVKEVGYTAFRASTARGRREIAHAQTRSGLAGSTLHNVVRHGFQGRRAGAGSTASWVSTCWPTSVIEGEHRQQDADGPRSERLSRRRRPPGRVHVADRPVGI